MPILLFKNSAHYSLLEFLRYSSSFLQEIVVNPERGNTCLIHICNFHKRPNRFAELVASFRNQGTKSGSAHAWYWWRTCVAPNALSARLDPELRLEDFTGPGELTVQSFILLQLKICCTQVIA
jgi:hypothetical protein